MKRIKKKGKISGFFLSLYKNLFRIDDSAQKIALGFGLGVFSGIIPGIGPIAALFLAFLLRVNRGSALLGCLLTNTWLSFLTLILAIKLGSAILGLRWQEVREAWILSLKGFHWLGLFKLSILKVILPVIIGYLIVAFCLGLLAYLVILTIINHKERNENKSRIYLPR